MTNLLLGSSINMRKSLQQIAVAAAAALLFLGVQVQWTQNNEQFVTAEFKQQQPQTNKPLLSCLFAKLPKVTPSPRNSSLPSELCERLPRGKSASALWRQYSNVILQASINHPADNVTHSSHADWMTQLFHLLSPRVLSRGLLVAPQSSDVETIRKILNRKLQSPDTAEPLRVAVFGGSVPEGRGCDYLPVEIQPLLKKNKSSPLPKISGRSCSWVYRWQLLADALLGPGVVQIFNLAAGGTSSKLAVPVLEYSLYHKHSPLRAAGGAHVVVNAYATNDGLFSWSHDPSVNNASASYQHYHKTAALAADFGQAALHSRPCRRDDDSEQQQRPVVIFLGEYLGNHHELLLGEEIRSDAVRYLSQLMGWTYVSSAMAVRPWVYANTNETLFSPQWWYSHSRRRQRPSDNNNNNKRKRDGHFGMPGHQMIAWVLAYAALEVAVEHCEDFWHQRLDDHVASSQQAPVHPDIIISTPATTTKELYRTTPPLLWNETAAGVAKAWLAKARQESAAEREYCAAAGKEAEPCIFAFVSTPAGTHRRAGALGGYMRSFQTSNTGWRAENDMRNGWQVRVRYYACALTEWSRYVLISCSLTPTKEQTRSCCTQVERHGCFQFSKYHKSSTLSHYPLIEKLRRTVDGLAGRVSPRGSKRKQRVPRVACN